MRCSELMKTDVEHCLDTASIASAAMAMRDRRVGFLPVCDAAGIVVGTITDRDIVLRVLAPVRSSEDSIVADAMTRELIACSPNDDVGVAEGLMVRFRKSRIVCTDAQGRIAGVISLSDIAKKVSQAQAGAVAASIAKREARPESIAPRSASRSTPCRDVMKTGLKSCREGDLVPHIAAMMHDYNVGFVPVCDANGALVGTITDRDLVMRVIAEGRPPETTRADEIFSRELVLCFPDDPLSSAEDLMIAHRKSRIVCVDVHRAPIGVISLSDLARVEPSKIVAGVLREISSRSSHPPI
jgi:CBS domain-containing protein